MLQQADLGTVWGNGQIKEFTLPEREGGFTEGKGEEFSSDGLPQWQTISVCVWISHGVFWFFLSHAVSITTEGLRRLAVFWLAWSCRTEDCGSVESCCSHDTADLLRVSDSQIEHLVSLSLSTCIWNSACPLTQPAVTALHARASHLDSFFPPLFFCMHLLCLPLPLSLN